MATQCVGSMRTSKGQSNTFLQGEKKKKVGVPVEQLVRRPPTSSRPGEGGAAKMDAGIASDSIVLGYDPVPSECDKC